MDNHGNLNSGDSNSGDFDGEDMDRINEEFDSLVSGLSLDESAPTTYLDELDALVDSEKFTPPKISRKKFSRSSIIQSLQSAKESIERWRNNRDGRNDDGAVL